MDLTDPTTPFIGALVGTGIVGLLITLAFAALAFVVSAFITALWVRLIMIFMRKALDREYGRMRMIGQGFEAGRMTVPHLNPPSTPLRNDQGPRGW